MYVLRHNYCKYWTKKLRMHFTWKNMNKEMLLLACHQCILKNMFEVVVVYVIEYSSGPDILLFIRFQKSRNKFYLENFESITFGIFTLYIISNISTYMISFTQKQFERPLLHFLFSFVSLGKNIQHKIVTS